MKDIEPYNHKTKVYKPGEIEMVYYKKAILPRGERDRTKDAKRGGSVKRSESIRTSQTRTIQKVYDYARSNDWQYFVTLTFDPKQTNRQDYQEVSRKLSQWLRNLKKRQAPDLKYLMVPELHKDGKSYHFHGLMTDIGTMELVDSGKITQDGLTIYNIGNYKLGFTTATEVQNSERTAKYVCKYITKELCGVTLNKKKYWTSRNLKTPIIDKRLIGKKQMQNEQEELETKCRRSKVVDLEFLEQEINYYQVGMAAPVPKRDNGCGSGKEDINE